MDTNVSTPTFDRTAEDLGNIVELGHVNVRVAGSEQSHRVLPDGPRPDPRPLSDGRPGQHVGVNVGRASSTCRPAAWTSSAAPPPW